MLNPNRIACLLVLLLLSGCATQVTNLSKDSAINLKPGEALILMGIKSDVNLKSIHVEGPTSFQFTKKQVLEGEAYYLFKVDAGDYEFDRIFVSDYTYYLLTEDAWSFTVNSGEINYVGDIEVMKNYSDIRSPFELVNNTSIALEFLEDEYGALLDNTPLHYAGPGQDRFIEFVMTLPKGMK